ncbi:MAG: MFS transporter [Gammaproteobacteria bacterium]|nr:MFS transporter [Gammaproteobacteria bacterium]MBU1465954.1 MFS transporter [Gammaproteobacteria bacterium]MBU2024280.1 MFS transporter [Gammaproteobacteria bacterium]MBU2238527.1 MFS transporter [Gammaproteobacteria bacterium]MBU2318984.1 MFS transporter [Gammaproteobacteria bacterium]
MLDKEVQKKANRRNIFKLVISQFLINLGDVLINPKVTLPWLLQSLGAPLYLLGWLVPIRESGSLLPQLIIAHFIYKVKVRKWVWVLGSLIQSLCVVVIGCAALLLDGVSAGWAIIVALIVFSVARGLNSVASKDVLGKTVVKNKRGRVAGWSSSASGLITIGIAFCTLFFFDSIQGNVSFYIWGIVAATMIWLFAALIYSLVQEPLSEVGDKGVNFIDVFKELSLLRTDSVFREFVIARSLFLCAALSAPYYVLIAQQRSENGVLILGLFILSSGLASLLSSPFWGLFSDHSSRKVMMFSSLLSAFTGVALFSTVKLFPQASFTTLLIVILYFVLSVAHQGVRIGRKTYLVNLGEGNKRTSYVSVSNTIIGFILLAMSSISLLTYSISLASLVLVFSIITLAGVYMVIRLPEV